MTDKIPEAIAVLDVEIQGIKDRVGAGRRMDNLIKARAAFAAEHEALRELKRCAIYLMNRVVETKGVKCMDDTHEAVKAAFEALAAVENLK